jgi:hypothetical protein
MSKTIVELVPLREVLATLSGGWSSTSLEAYVDRLVAAGVDVHTNWRGEPCVASDVAASLIAEATEGQKQAARELADYHDYVASFQESRRAAYDEAFAAEYERQRSLEENQLVKEIQSGFTSWSGVVTSQGNSYSWPGSPEARSKAQSAGQEAATEFVEQAAGMHTDVTRDGNGGIVAVRPLDVTGWRAAGRPARFDDKKGKRR